TIATAPTPAATHHQRTDRTTAAPSSQARESSPDARRQRRVTPAVEPGTSRGHRGVAAGSRSSAGGFGTGGGQHAPPERADGRGQFGTADDPVRRPDHRELLGVPVRIAGTP